MIQNAIDSLQRFKSKKTMGSKSNRVGRGIGGRTISIRSVAGVFISAGVEEASVQLSLPRL